MTSKPKSLIEMAGCVAGAIIAPIFAAGSLIRRARIFHPDGVCYQARVQAVADTPQLAPLAKSLAGDALVRLSSAWWRKGKEWPDVLGCSVRFGLTRPITTAAPPDAQDLLAATIPRPWLTPLGPLLTDTHDFLDNSYHGTSPFEIDGVGLVRLKLVPQPDTEMGFSRLHRLERAVASGKASFVLMMQQIKGGHVWIPLVEIRLEEKLNLDQAALRFSPFRDGRGLRPRGFIHSLRRAVYPASQRARPQR